MNCNDRDEVTCRRCIFKNGYQQDQNAVKINERTLGHGNDIYYLQMTSGIEKLRVYRRQEGGLSVANGKLLRMNI